MKEEINKNMPCKFLCCQDNQNSNFMSIIDYYDHTNTEISYYSYFFVATPKTVRAPPTFEEEYKLPRLIPSTLIIV